MKYFLSFYKQYSNKIYNYFFYRVNFNVEVAEDLTSEVFLKAHEHFSNFDQSRSFQAWIFTIAHNHLVNHYRDSKTHFSFDQLSKMGIQFADETYKKIIAKSESLHILKHLDKLTEKYKEMIILRYIDELSYEEIAEVTGETQNNARVIMHRGLRQLNEIIDK